MGLAIGVGVLADLLHNDAEGAGFLRKRIEKLNTLLVAKGLKPHEEPEKLPYFVTRSVRSFPYGFLHYLRRAYACAIEDVPLRQGEMTKADQDFIMEATLNVMDSHLLSHSDCEGFYIPQAFTDPLCDNTLPGGFAGSCQQLIKELVRVAPLLKIRCDGETLPKSEAEKLASVEDNGEPLWREKMVWFSLFEAAKFSIARNTLLVFH